jgi:hypothetical protein
MVQKSFFTVFDDSNSGGGAMIAGRSFQQKNKKCIIIILTIHIHVNNMRKWVKSVKEADS